MLSIEEVKEKGLSSCVNVFGTDFVKEHIKGFYISYTTEPDSAGDVMYFMGYSEEDMVKKKNNQFTFNDRTDYLYYVICFINVNDSSVAIFDSIVPVRWC